MMKRLIYFAFAALLLISCEKQIDETAPTISWAANPGFATQELGIGADGALALAAPGKIESLTITLGLGDYALLANPYISISSNKSANGKLPVFDVIDDAAVAAYLNGMGMTAGNGLRGKTIGTINLIAIIESIITGQVVDNNSSFTMSIKLTDQAGKTVSRNASFHYTAAPSVVWTGNSNFDIVDLDGASKPSKVKISAPGKIDALTLTLEFGGSAELANYVKNRTSNSSLVIDLVNDEMVAEAFKFPTAKTIVGKSEVNLDLSFMYNISYDLSPSTNVFTLKVTDKIGKSVAVPLKFKKSEKQ